MQPRLQAFVILGDPKITVQGLRDDCKGTGWCGKQLNIALLENKHFGDQTSVRPFAHFHVVVVVEKAMVCELDIGCCRSRMIEECAVDPNC